MSITERVKLELEEDAAAEEKEALTVVFVFNEQTDKAEIRVVKSGIQDDKYIEISEGIKEGDLIITGPYEQVARKMKPGDKVTRKKKSGEEENDNGDNS